MSDIISSILIRLLPRLMKIGLSSLGDLVKEFPEITTRSMLLRIQRPGGQPILLWAGFKGGEPHVIEIEPGKPVSATTEITLHIDTLISILKGRLDFRAAYLYDLIDIKSNDGLPASYHFILWAAFFDKLEEILKTKILP